MKDKLRYVSNNIKSYRMRAGYTQDKMADLLGVARVTYCDYEVNPQRVKIETFQQIADILKCKLSDFFIEFYVTKSDSNLNQPVKDEYETQKEKE